MHFPLVEVGPGIFRPIVAAVLCGPTRTGLVDGILDTGADRTILPLDLASSLGLDLLDPAEELTLETATGQDVHCKIVAVTLGLIRDFEKVYWRAEVAVATAAMKRPHWGFKGFLEFFHFHFDGPGRAVVLTPGQNLQILSSPN